MKKTGNSLVDDSTAEWIVGSDEAGYGTWAGDLVVVGTAVPRDWNDNNVQDSKALKDREREAVVRKYRKTVLWKAIRVSPTHIDAVGVWNALIQAHNETHAFLGESLTSQGVQSSVLHIVDGLENARNKLLSHLIPMAKADTKVPAVSLASCFAKVIQCKLMDQADKDYPGYGFRSHRGYHSPQHVAALKKLGVCPLHRRSYSSVKAYLKKPSQSETIEDFFDDWGSNPDS